MSGNPALHYSTVLAQRRMKTLELKICHYLNCESCIHLSVLGKTNARSEKRTENSGRLAELYNVKATSHVNVERLAKRFPPIQRFTIFI